MKPGLIPTRVARLLCRPRLALGAAILAAAVSAKLLVDPPPAPTSLPPSLERSAGVRPADREPPVAPPVLSDSLAAGETLSLVWERNARPADEISAVVSAASAVFDVRQLRAGAPIEMYLRGPGHDWGGGAPGGVPVSSAAAPLDSVLIRIDAERRLALLADGASAFRGEVRETPVREVYRTYVGCIETSLYEALESEAGDFSLFALELDRIYGGQIDFYSDLHPDDCVSLYFHAFERPDGSLRLGRIESAELVNKGKRHRAVWFRAPDGTADYYDPSGRSLKRQFLRSPLKFTRISSGFTLRRFHPVLKRYRAHLGIDYAAPAGSPVQAAGNGIVTFAGWKRGYGKVVEIRHGKVYETSYAHLSRIPAGVRAGRRVSQGEVIGYVGSTGLSTGPHLDYRFSKNGVFVNPLKEKFVSGEPVAPQYASLFADQRDHALRMLASPETVLAGAAAFGAPVARGAAALGAVLTPGEAAEPGISFGDD